MHQQFESQIVFEQITGVYQDLVEVVFVEEDVTPVFLAFDEPVVVAVTPESDATVLELPRFLVSTIFVARLDTIDL